MTPFTYATSSGTLVIGDDPGHAFIEIFDGNDRAYASIPNSAGLGVAAALLEAAGYGREAAALPKAAGEPDTSSMATLYEAQDGLDQVVRKALDRWMADKLDAKVEGINQAEKRYQYDEGFKDGYAEARAEVDAKHLPWKYAMKSDTSSLDEMTRTASEDGTADEVDEFVNTRPTFAVGDRVRHIEDAEHGTVRGLCYWPGCDIKRYMKECFR